MELIAGPPKRVLDASQCNAWPPGAGQKLRRGLQAAQEGSLRPRATGAGLPNLSGMRRHPLQDTPANLYPGTARGRTMLTVLSKMRTCRK